MRYIKDNQQIGIHRKCGCCGEDFYISNENISDAIYYDKKTYHSGCFINICNKRSQMKREDVSQKWTWILEHLELVKNDSYTHLSFAIAKENVFDFIKASYDITIIPTTVWQKIGNIYNGTFKGMTKGIPPEHLLDMWKRKIDMLNGIAAKNRVKGINMSADQRLSYDLSILVNKYDSYLKFLEKQKIIETESVKNAKLVKTQIATSIINAKANESSEDKRNNDMSDLVDDIFED